MNVYYFQNGIIHNKFKIMILKGIWYKHDFCLLRIDG